MNLSWSFQPVSAMSNYQLEPPDPAADRRSAVRVVTLLALVVLVVGALSALIFLAGDSLIFGPTPTPTSTPRPPATPTRNAMATRVQEDMLTQAAFPADAVGIDIGRGTRVAMVTPTPAVTQTVIAPGVTPTSVSNLPIVVRPGDEQTAIPVETATLTATPTETETPTPTPTDTATPVELATTAPTDRKSVV